MKYLEGLKNPRNLRIVFFSLILMILMGVFLFIMVVSNQQMGYKAKADGVKKSMVQGSSQQDWSASAAKIIEELTKEKKNESREDIREKTLVVPANNIGTVVVAPTTVPTNTPIPTQAPIPTSTPATGQGIFVVIDNNSLDSHQIDGTQAMLTKTCQDASTSWLALGSDSIKTTNQVRIPYLFLQDHPGYNNLIAPNKSSVNIYECIPLSSN